MTELGMDYELQLKIKNAPFLNMMRRMGIETVAELSRRCGIAQTELGKIANLKIIPYKERSDPPVFRKSVLAVANTLMCEPHELFPEKHLHDPLVLNTFTAQVKSETLESLTHKSSQDPAAFLEFLEEESKDQFEAMLATTRADGNSVLTEREKTILRYRFRDNMTYTDIAKIIGVSGNRIKQIIDKAFRKLRHPINAESVVNAAGRYATNKHIERTENLKQWHEKNWGKK